MFCLGALSEVSNGGFAYLSLAIAWEKRRSPEGLLHDRFDVILTAAFGAVGAIRRLSLLELKVHEAPVAQPQDPRCDVPMQLPCYRTRASQ